MKRNEEIYSEVISKHRDKLNLSNKLKFQREYMWVNIKVAGTKYTKNWLKSNLLNQRIMCFTYDFQSLTHSENDSINLPDVSLSLFLSVLLVARTFSLYVDVPLAMHKIAQPSQMAFGCII